MKEIISYGRFQCPELSPHKNHGMEITYIEKGVMEWMVDGVREKVEPGCVFFTLPWQVHGSLNPKEPDNTIWHILFHIDQEGPCRHFNFPKSLGFRAAEMKMLSSVFASSYRHCFPATANMRRLMPELIGELQSKHDLREAQTQTLLRAVLVELKRIVTGEAVYTGTNSASEKKVQLLLSELSANCNQQWNLQQMANLCGIQRTRLSTIFQKLTGSTPMEYLTRLRIERAKRLLCETDMKVIDIAFECGFSTSQYFAKIFRDISGVTPSQYRRHVSRLSAAEFKNLTNIQFRSEEEERQRVQAFSAE